jgi:hypothetical protein
MFETLTGVQRVFAKDKALEMNAPSLNAAMGANLFLFMAIRAQQSFGNLIWQNYLNIPNPITLTVDSNGATTAAAYNFGIAHL